MEHSPKIHIVVDTEEGRASYALVEDGRVLATFYSAREAIRELERLNGRSQTHRGMSKEH